MQIRDVMTSHVLTIREDDSIERAIQMMLWSGVRHLPVVRGKEVVGVLTEGNILTHQAEPRSPANEIHVDYVMTKPVEVTNPGENVNAAAARMVTTRIGCLPVVEQGKLVGIVTRSDVLAQSAGAAVPAGAGVIRVSQVMHAAPVLIRGDDDLLAAAARMVEHGIRHLPVVGEEGRIIGILSDRDVRTVIGDPRRAVDDPETRHRVRALKVWAAMMTPAITVHPNARLSDAVGHFVDQRVGALPVVDDSERPVGILSYVDALRALDERSRVFER